MTKHVPLEPDEHRRILLMLRNSVPYRQVAAFVGRPFGTVATIGRVAIQMGILPRADRGMYPGERHADHHR